MAFLDDVGNYLQAEGIGTLGTDLFMGMITEGPPSAVTLLSYAGRQSDFGGQGSAVIEYPRLQVIARDFDPPTAEQKVADIRDLLSQVDVSTPLNGNTYYFVKPLHAVIALGRDENEHYLYSCSFEVGRAL